MATQMKDWLAARFRSVAVQQGVAMWTALMVAGGLDYVVNILAGRWLQPAQFGVFIGVAALLQLLVYPSNGIRNIVAFYTVSLNVASNPVPQVGAFTQRAWRWAWRWGLAAGAIMVLLSPFLAPLLQFPNAWPLWAAAPMLPALLARSVTDGALQGMLAFARVGAVQLIQSALRLVFAAGLIWLGGQATGAIAALPLASLTALWLAIWWLRPYLRERTGVIARQVSSRYSSLALLGLVTFGTLVNFDALFVKHFFNPRAAGNYGAVVTLAKISLFLTLSFGTMLFPQAKLRLATGRDVRPILLLALAGALAPGLGLSTLYLMASGRLVRTIFSTAYGDPGIVLALASLAATLYAGLNVWLNYALALERPAFIYALLGVLFWQGAGMYQFGRASFVHMAMVMVSAGVLGNLAGFITTWYAVRATTKLQAELAEVG